ncbi:MAG: hypothetical protein ACXVBB_23545 [Isosphaeraceae bacterium]
MSSTGPQELNATAIISLIESGSYPRDVLLTFARGFLPLEQAEVIAVLACLNGSDDPEIAAAARTYHLRNSRDRVKKSIGRVQRPRHFLLYRTTDDGKVEIGRVLHDGMDLTRHLPVEYRAADWDEGGLG